MKAQRLRAAAQSESQTLGGAVESGCGPAARKPPVASPPAVRFTRTAGLFVDSSMPLCGPASAGLLSAQPRLFPTPLSPQGRPSVALWIDKIDCL